MKPAADQIARITAEGLAGISAWFKEHGAALAAWISDIAERLKKVYDLLMLINKIPVLFDLPAAIKRWMTPTRLNKLPGSPGPEQENPALQQGKAGERYRAALKEQENRTVPGAGWGTPMNPKIIRAAAEEAAASAAMPSGPGLTPTHYANVRHMNPGAQYPGASSRMFGGVSRTLGSGHKIASFPTPVHGAASNMQLLATSKHYLGKTIAQAMTTWSGGSRSMPGGGKWDPNMKITREMTQDPSFMIPFMKAVAAGEAPGKYPMSEGQWSTAFDWYRKGGPKGASLKDMVPPMTQRTSGQTPTNITMNSPITVNGVAPGKEAMVAQQVSKAIRDPTRELLDRIKSARSYESRLGYV